MFTFVVERPMQYLVYESNCIQDGDVANYSGADKSLARTEKKIERSPFFVRRGGHCCRGDLVGRTAFWIFLSGLQNLEFVRCNLFPSWSV